MGSGKPGSDPYPFSQRRSDVDDREIRRLEKLLKLNKRKKKDTLPATFKAEGLDCILTFDNVSVSWSLGKRQPFLPPFIEDRLNLSPTSDDIVFEGGGRMAVRFHKTKCLLY